MRQAVGSMGREDWHKGLVGDLEDSSHHDAVFELETLHNGTLEG